MAMSESLSYLRLAQLGESLDQDSEDISLVEPHSCGVSKLLASCQI